MTRFFSFGCSFTNYTWPTWADIFGSQFDEHQNWGKTGAGNQFIMDSLVECHLKNKISIDDVVGIMWTNVTRFDTYRKKYWHTPGNLYTQNHYSQEVIDSIDDTRGFYIKNLASIFMAVQLLEKIGCRYHMFSMVDMTNHLQYEANDASYHIQDILPFYQNILDKIKPSVHQVVFNYDWNSRPFLMEKSLNNLKKHYQQLAGPDWPEFEKIFDVETQKITKKSILKEIFNLNRWDWKKLYSQSRRIDTHPTPLEHLEYLRKVLPEYKISHDTYTVVKEIDDLLRNDKKITPELLKKIQKNKIPVKRW